MTDAPPAYSKNPYAQTNQQPAGAPVYGQKVNSAQPQQQLQPQQAAYAQQPSYAPQQPYQQPGRPQQVVYQPQAIPQGTVVVAAAPGAYPGVFYRVFPSQKRFVVAFLLGFVAISGFVGLGATDRGWMRIEFTFSTTTFHFGWRETENGDTLEDELKEGGDSAVAFSVLAAIAGIVGSSVASLARDRGGPQKSICVTLSLACALFEILAFAIFSAKTHEYYSEVSNITIGLGYAGSMAVAGMICSFVALAMSAGPWTFPPANYVPQQHPQQAFQQQVIVQQQQPVPMQQAPGTYAQPPQQQQQQQQQQQGYVARVVKA